MNKYVHNTWMFLFIFFCFISFCNISNISFALSSKYSGKRNIFFQKHGFGIHTNKKGNVYEGKWKWGKRNGKGKLTINVNGKIGIFEGNWLNGVLHGKVVVKIDDHMTFSGNFKNGDYDNNGVLKYRCGIIVQGEWNRDIFLILNGNASVLFKNGDRYQAYFKGKKLIINEADRKLEEMIRGYPFDDKSLEDHLIKGLIITNLKRFNILNQRIAAKLIKQLLEHTNNNNERLDFIIQFFYFKEDDIQELHKVVSEIEDELDLYIEQNNQHEIISMLIETGPCKWRKIELLKSIPSSLEKIKFILKENIPLHYIYKVFYQELSDIEREKILLIIQDYLSQPINTDGIRRMAKFIVNAKNNLHLYLTDEHPLFQDAMNKLILIQNLNDKKNPYGIYKMLQEISPINESDFAIEKISKKNYLINSKVLFRSMKQRITKSQLPQNINSLKYRKLINKFKENVLEINDLNLKNKFRSEIGILQNRYFYNLLENKDFYPSTPTYQFKAIIDFISKSSKEFDKFYPKLTQRDLKLSTLGEMFKTCNTGKKRIINQYYSSVLPSEFRIFPNGNGIADYNFDKDGEDEDIIDAKIGAVYIKNVINPFILEGIENLITSSDDFFKKVVGISKDEIVVQAPHQITHLKNILFKSLDISENIEFDPHTQMIDQRLLNLKHSEILKIFFDSFKPSDLITIVKNQINNILKTGNEKIVHTLTKSINNILFDMNLYQVWEYNQNSYKIEKIKKYGALLILVTLNYLTEY